jgi:hypothetical protein
LEQSEQIRFEDDTEIHDAKCFLTNERPRATQKLTDELRMQYRTRTTSADQLLVVGKLERWPDTLERLDVLRLEYHIMKYRSSTNTMEKLRESIVDGELPPHDVLDNSLQLMQILPSGIKPAIHMQTDSERMLLNSEGPWQEASRTAKSLGHDNRKLEAELKEKNEAMRKAIRELKD